MQLLYKFMQSYLNVAELAMRFEWHVCVPGKQRPAIRPERNTVKRYICNVCGYIYDPKVGDPEHGIQPGTSFEVLPETWVCPECGVGKDEFSPE